MKSQIPVRKGISKRICTTLYHANHLLLTVITFSFYQSPKLGYRITVPLMPIYKILLWTARAQTAIYMLTRTNLMACNGPKSRLGLIPKPWQKVSPARTQKMTQIPKRMAVSSKQREKSTSSWQLVLAAGVWLKVHEIVPFVHCEYNMT